MDLQAVADRGVQVSHSIMAVCGQCGWGSPRGDYVCADCFFNVWLIVQWFGGCK